MNEVKPVLKRKQRARVESLKASREVLEETSGGAFAKEHKSVDVIDLQNVAAWIIDGKDPWAPKEEKKV